MKIQLSFTIIFLIIGLLFSSCKSQDVQQPLNSPEVELNQTPEATMKVIDVDEGASEIQSTQVQGSLFLSVPGPYFAGNREYTIVDESRNGREIHLLIWYPASIEYNSDGKPIVRDALPNTSDAPYPVILTEENSGRYFFLSHLASHGFVMVVVRSPKTIQGEPLGAFPLFDQAQDFLLTLDQIGSKPPEGLEGMFDSNHVGVTGYSYGGDITLTIGGVRLDPGFYLSQCKQINSIVPEKYQWVYRDFYCYEAENWEDYVTYAGEKITTSEDGLWQPMTDPRIKAIMPMAPTVSWYYGERGLGSVTIPTLLVWGTKDDLSPYPLEAPFTFENLGSKEKFLISFIGRTHMLPQLEEAALQVKHFSTAFFGYYLQGREEYAEYFSEEFISQNEAFHWGVYQEP